MKLKKSIQLHSGTIIPAGTELHFSNEGHGFFNGEDVNIYGIPTHAIDMPALEATSDSYDPVNNELDPGANLIPFDSIKPGQLGYDVYGKPVTILGKAKGEAGFTSLVRQFGNASDFDFADLVSMHKQKDTEEILLVAYSTHEDGKVFVDLYGADTVVAITKAVATEADASAIVPFEEVEAGDTAFDKSGKAFKVYGKGCGKTWFEQTAEEQDLKLDWDDFKGDSDKGEVELVYGAYERGTKTIVCYGAKGVTVRA